MWIFFIMLLVTGPRGGLGLVDAFGLRLIRITSLLVKRFRKYLKRKGNKGNQRRYISKQNDSSNSSKFSCYNCGKQGHIKIECPNVNKEKEKIGDRKKEKKSNEKRASIA